MGLGLLPRDLGFSVWMGAMSQLRLAASTEVGSGVCQESEPMVTIPRSQSSEHTEKQYNLILDTPVVWKRATLAHGKALPFRAVRGAWH